MEKQKTGQPARTPSEHLDLRALHLNRADLRALLHCVVEPRGRRRRGGAELRKRRLQMRIIHVAETIPEKSSSSLTAGRSSPPSYAQVKRWAG
jgi:hypothetical protein